MNGWREGIARQHFGKKGEPSFISTNDNSYFDGDTSGGEGDEGRGEVEGKITKGRKS